jgi:hypothetical protein
MRKTTTFSPLTLGDDGVVPYDTGGYDDDDRGDGGDGDRDRGSRSSDDEDEHTPLDDDNESTGGRKNEVENEGVHSESGSGSMVKEDRVLKLAKSIYSRVQSKTVNNASSYIKNTLDPDRPLNIMVKSPFSLIHIHREKLLGIHTDANPATPASSSSEGFGNTSGSSGGSGGSGGNNNASKITAGMTVRRLMRCHMRLCGLMLTSTVRWWLIEMLLLFHIIL